MQRAFWSRNWGAVESLYAADPLSGDMAPLSAQDRSLYLNALWLQGKYSEGVAILESMKLNENEAENFPPDLAPYASMLMVLGQERIGRKEEAYENGKVLWAAAPESLKYYLAFALGRLSRDLSLPDESLEWFRRMLELSPDKKRRLQALTQMIALPGVSADEGAALLIDSQSNAAALAFCAALPKGSSARAEYALGYNDYINKKYDSAAARFELASRDAYCGEAARYYLAYSAYRTNKNALAFSLWSEIALAENEYPQRSVQRLASLARRGMTKDVIRTLQSVAEARDDYPDVAADALVVIIGLDQGGASEEAARLLYSKHGASNQAAASRWEKGWKAWKAKNYRTAQEQWAAGFSPEIKNRELGSRLLYWQARALEKLNSPKAAARVRQKLVDLYPAEYHTFLVSPDGGVKSGDAPASYDRGSRLEEWGFVTYARLAAEADSGKNGAPDVPSLYSATRLALWEGDFSSAMRIFAVLQRAVPASEYALEGLMRYHFPRAFEREVLAASEKTGVEPAVIWGVMRQESLFEPDVISSAGAYGLMQLMPATGRQEARKMKLDENAYRRTAENVLLGANHLVGLFARFGDAPRSLAAYNAGGSPVTRWSREPITDMPEWIEDIAYSETRGYVKAVLRNIEAYRLLYRK
ncbi:MAG: lytic transglycosylase domain-containing protein [Synergistaceae bacterium]|nr:lytic transglycosylase domain-containing protein [Synergistaceae bacterium]